MQIQSLYRTLREAYIQCGNICLKPQIIFSLSLGMIEEAQKDIKLLGGRIEELRKGKGLSMREFANLCEISKTQVNELGNAGVDFRYSTLVTVSELINF
jgi:hypothetical protein